MLRLETIQRAPKAMLHDHLDGGLRPTTIVELAGEYGYDGLPTTDPDATRGGSFAASTPARRSSFSSYASRSSRRLSVSHAAVIDMWEAAATPVNRIAR